MVSRMNRREFLETGGKAALGVGLGMAVADALATPTYAQEPKVSANEKIVLGIIGVGGMGEGNMQGFMKHSQAEVAAVCDVHQSRLNRAADMVEKKYGRKPMDVQS